MNELRNNREIVKVISHVAEVGRYIWQNGWAESNAGNISVNVSHLIFEKFINIEKYPIYKLSETYIEIANKYLFITGTGKRMRDLAHSPLENALFIKISKDGKSYSILLDNEKDTPVFLPTSEIPTHLSIHNQIAVRGSNEKVIIHTHASELIALTHNPEFKTKEQINKIIWGMHPETIMFIPKGIGFVPYTIPGSVEIARKTLDEFKTNNIILWEKHGVFSIGEEVINTYDKIDIISKSVKMWFMCKQAGFAPEMLNEEQLSELKKAYDSNY